jgi:hypothetical protein
MFPPKLSSHTHALRTQVSSTAPAVVEAQSRLAALYPDYSITRMAPAVLDGCDACVNPTQVCINITQVCINITQVCVNPTQVCVNLTQVCVNLTQVCVNRYNPIPRCVLTLLRRVYAG